MGFVNSKKFDGVQLYKKANGDISYYIRFKDETNTLRRIKVGDKSKGINEALCFQKRNDVINRIRLGEEFAPNARKFSFHEAFKHYIEWAKVNKATWKHNDYQTYHKHLDPSLGKMPVLNLKSKHFEDLKQAKLEEGYKPRTVAHILGTARQIINYAINNELVKNYTNPIAGGRVKMPKIDNAKLGYLSREQAKEILDTLEARDHKLAYHLTFILLYTGARFSEVTGLKWYDVNFETRLIFFNTSKEGAPRHIYISDQLLELLKELKQNATSQNDFVVPSSNGERVAQMPRQWYIIVNDLIPNNKKAGKYKITVHSLRHTHASWLAISGMNILAIKEQLGHKKLDMTLRYSHLIPSQRHEQTGEIFNTI